jgi:hypothetical protein
MALVTAAFITYDATGNREDLIDVITNISPVDNWFTANSGSNRATARIHQWQTDSLSAASENAEVEGSVATAAAITATNLLQNSCQILRKVFAISDTQEAVESAGRPSEIGYQTTKILKELSKDIEYALLVNSSETTGASATARVMNGAIGWITSNETTAAATASSITETLFNDNLQLIWAQGGSPSTALTHAYQKRQISGFTTNTRNITAEANKIVSAVDMYESDFGLVQIRLSHALQDSLTGDTIVFGDMNLWNKSWLRPVKREELARTGSARTFMIEAELTLESLQQLGSGKLTGFRHV